ncbi:unnamed protein product [Cyprideis torosa]|uniref:Uncharacterized protein n=1 Tax=Cyprideis torosa TaxID=163714 RepID=A0A7R8WKF4_9CRUS|nr:unnamed protein product [Cyprideis torosa]CAD7233692.1 unnamed protein product [Cyprideis torosa]CAG0896831.1 unnamed protein product [Cyprideis torosa]CAG0903749.1 unnamed protein product [Cyprideis torosa]
MYSRKAYDQGNLSFRSVPGGRALSSVQPLNHEIPGPGLGSEVLSTVIHHPNGNNPGHIAHCREGHPKSWFKPCLSVVARLRLQSPTKIFGDKAAMDFM